MDTTNTTGSGSAFRRFARATTALLAGWSIATAAWAGPAGELDATYGAGGRLALPRIGDGSLYAPLVLADGRAITTSMSAGDVVVARWNADGSPDRSFGVAGQQVVDLGSNFDVAAALAQQPDGGLLVAGVSSDGASGTVAIARLDRDGALDPTFGTAGRATTTFPDHGLNAPRLQVTPDSHIVVAVEAWSTGLSDIALFRLDARGMRDAAFGTDGVLYIDAGRSESLGAVIAQPDGRYVVCGTSDSGWDPDGSMFAARSEANGALDRSFGTAGVWVRGTATSYSQANACLLLSDGALVIAGSPDLVRLTAAGALDTTAWRDGTATSTHDGGYGWTNAVLPIADGRLALTGVQLLTYGSGEPDMFVSVLDPATGLLDPDFGDRGTTIVDVRGNDQWGGAFGTTLAQQADGSLLALGVVNREPKHFTVARLRTDRVGNPGVAAILEWAPTVNERDGSITLHVRRSGGSLGALRIDYRTDAANAAAGADFVATQGTLEWQDGEAGTKTISVTINADRESELDEKFHVVLTGPAGRILREDAVVTIVDPTPPPAVVPPPPPTRASSGGGGALGLPTLLALLGVASLRALARRRRET